ncbi:preprotein translocase subunit SecA [Roseibacillus ishigakijimensis]|uniref:Protein translocase subunit SecA n=1 Tax=Roseibacillus ishigakijimensis TaxID=454146 RepID=A0A934VKM6_9BACT|nr:preprotein translocase subunit SecA [Roseibacillus ishigakijimensis]MBK1833809.1 preprotein translocase subunit SecA [Roseibacillus ishigakijimensis]
MLKWTLQKIVGTKNQREVKRLRPIAARINEIEEALQQEPESILVEKTRGWQQKLHRFLPLHTPTKRAIEQLPPEQLKELADMLGERLEALRPDFPNLPQVEATPASIEKAKAAFHEIEDQFPKLREKYLEEILPEAYAVVKNGARRMCGRTIEVADQELTWEMVHFDVQLVGGIGLHRGIIAEMQTGEGKTLVATLPVYLNALTGMGVHVITVNDYLARRDSEWMGSLYRYLGLSVGCIQNGQPPQERRAHYGCDITYGTNAEFGFDYLRDNGMASSANQQVQRGHYFAIIDEVDSILIDEARTPLIISGPSTVATSTEKYVQYKGMVEALVKKQNTLCGELAATAQKQLDDKDYEEAGRTLFKLKLAQPRNRQLLRFMEDPDTRRIIEKAELAMYQDTQKKDLFEAKEELYYTIDEKGHDTDLMEMGREFLSPGDPEAFVLPDLASAYAEIDAQLDLTDEERAQRKDEVTVKLDEQGEKMHVITQLLKAYCIYEKDVEYVVQNNKVVIVDENTGREMPGRRWSDGLHQAVEAKENCEIEAETQTYATITIQNYFRLYTKLAGMTGTAETEAAEFKDIYNLDVLPIPTNRPNQRIDENDQVFKTRREKYNAVVTKIKEAHDKGQPVLCGTASVESSETLSRMLKRAKIPHKVLNAKFHRQEAEIVQAAGQRGAVTVATNMAGRGTDIKLGEGIAELGGLFVIGTERHESRRIDRQLRGRCSRQGDPGMSQFYISFEDDLMRNFAAADRMTNMMERFGMEEGEALEHKWLNRSVETAQKRVEQHRYRQRKYVLDFDDVMNNQREVVYGYRNEVLTSEDPRELLYEVVDKVIPEKVDFYINQRDEGASDILELIGWANTTFPLRLKKEEVKFEDKSADEISEFLVEQVKKAYEVKVAHEIPQMLDDLERQIILVAIDRQWQQHLYNMDSLRDGISLRAQGQKDPLVEYKNEAYKLFEELMANIEEEALGNLFRSYTNLEAYEQFLHNLPMQMGGQAPDHGQMAKRNLTGPSTEPPKARKPEVKLTLPKRRPTVKVGRNDDCPCGSGKKFKSCCGQED